MMRKTNRSGVIIVPIVQSTLSTPIASDDESSHDATQKNATQKPFPFLKLPSELRNKIYSMTFAAAPPVLDLDPSIFRLLSRQQMFAIFRTSRRKHAKSCLILPP
jgi:hypothetical protein